MYSNSKATLAEQNIVRIIAQLSQPATHRELINDTLEPYKMSFLLKEMCSALKVCR